MPSNADQIRLLELQGLDSSLAKLRHNRQNDPSIAQVKDLEAKLSDLNKSLLAAKTAAGDQAREVAKVQAFIDEANDRIARNQQKIDKGDLNHKDTLAVSEEMTALVTRIAELENNLLEAMEQHEACLAGEADIAQAHQNVASALADAVLARDQKLEAITNEGRSVIQERDRVAREINPTLVGQYDKLRVRLGGVGAARYWGGRCEGCGLELPPSEKETVENAAPDKVTRCDECGRILVRVPQ